MIYEYECDNCGYKFEKDQKITDNSLKKCPECKKNKLYRVITGGAGFLFNGTGQYKGQKYGKLSDSQMDWSD